LAGIKLGHFGENAITTTT